MSGTIMKKTIVKRRAHALYRAELAGYAGRYEDMVAEMRSIANMDITLSPKERKMLRLAYRKVAKARHASLSSILGVEEEERNRPGTNDNLTPIKTYREKIQDELNKVCAEIIEILDEYLIPKAHTPESIVYYYGMKGDFYRYKGEFLSGETLADCTSKSADAYEKAIDISNQLPSGHPARLGVTLNFSVFLREVLKDRDKAISVARVALDKAPEDLDHLRGEEYRDSTIAIQVLRDNLIMWESEDP